MREGVKMAESYLPKVRGEIIRPPETHGRWENYPILLSGLPKDLEIDEIPETTSIPSCSIKKCLKCRK